MNTLSQFTTYVETANNNQRLDIEHIQAYVIDELQRQNAAANQTKQICEQKLVQLQYQLEDVSLFYLFIMTATGKKRTADVATGNTVIKLWFITLTISLSYS